MLEAAVIALRLLQYAAGSVLLGSALFFTYALPRRGSQSAAGFAWPRRLLLAAAPMLAVSAALGLLAQTALLAGSVEAALTPDALRAVVGGMDLGKAAVVRILAAALALFVLLMGRPGFAIWAATATLGAMAVASFGWMGHGAATEGAAGTYHLAADVIHAFTSAVWVGALAAFVFLLRGGADLVTVHEALQRFSRLGVPLVAVIVLTGVVNGWFLIGLDRIAGLATTGYGRLLLTKLAMVAAMLVLAGANRLRHTPRLGEALVDEEAGSLAVKALRRSVAAEALLGFSVLAAVAWFGTLPPPTSG